MLNLVELGLDGWWTASSILVVVYDTLTEEQKERIRKSHEEKFGKTPDIDPFLGLGKDKHRFEESFFLPYENHMRNRESDFELTNPDPDCVICRLLKSY